MTDPSTEAFLPTMMTVQASDVRSWRQVKHFPESSWTDAETRMKAKAAKTKTSQIDLFRSI
jgi:hypothetical protein